MIRNPLEFQQFFFRFWLIQAMNIFHFSPIFKRVLYYCSHIVQAWDYIQFHIVANYFKLIYFRVIWLNNSTGMQHVKMRARYVHFFVARNYFICNYCLQWALPFQLYHCVIFQRELSLYRVSFFHSCIYEHTIIELDTLCQHFWPTNHA